MAVRPPYGSDGESAGAGVDFALPSSGKFSLHGERLCVRLSLAAHPKRAQEVVGLLENLAQLAAPRGSALPTTTVG